jgi:carbamoyltransferase
LRQRQDNGERARTGNLAKSWKPTSTPSPKGASENIAWKRRLDGHVWFPHSLGAFYQAITQYLGFPRYGDEYKVMGLAPYGEPRFLAEMRRIVRLRDDGSFALDLSYFRHHNERIAYRWTGGAPHVGTLFSPALEEALGPACDPSEPLDQRHRAIASSAQAMYEEAFFHLLGALHPAMVSTASRLRAAAL